MKRDTVRQILNAASVILTIAVNGLANALPLNGLTTGEISGRFDVYFVPAGYVFSIWGLIYLALTAFAVYQGLPSQRENPRLRSVGYLFPLSCSANIAWLFLWHYELFPLTIVAMVALLLLLIAIYLKLKIGRTEAPPAEKWFVRVPFSIYLGWVTVATIANATSLLDYLNWGGWGMSPETWAAIMLAVTTGLTAVVTFTRGDIAYGAVAVWALAGIAVKHAGTPLVATVAWASAAGAALVTAAGAWSHHRRAATARQAG